MGDVAKEIHGLRGQHAKVVSALSEMDEAGKAESADYRRLAEIKEKIEDLLHAHRLDLLRIGAAGQLQMTGELQEVLPLDDAESLEKANPLAGGKGVALDQDAIEARQDAQAQVLVKAGKFAFVILGGAHDLKDNLAKVAGGKCEYVTVTTQNHRKFATD